MTHRIRVGPLGVNAYILEYNNTLVLVDPGDEYEPTFSFFESHKTAPSIIVATHGHLDHTAAIPRLLEAFTKNGVAVQLAVHNADACYFGKEGEKTNRELFSRIGFSTYFEARWASMPEPSLLLSEGSHIPGTALSVLHTPGHSAGSICLYDENAGILLSGDTLFRDGIGRTDGPDSDYSALVKSIARLCELPSETKVLPGHGPETSIGREREYGV